MKTLITSIMLLTLAVVIVSAKPLSETVLLPSTGEIVYSSATSKDNQSLITITGTYSMWGQSKTIGNGVDAIWYYDVPEFGNTSNC